MAKFTADQARRTSLDRYAGINGPPAPLQSGSVDDSVVAGGLATVDLGNPANLAAAPFDSLTRSGQTLTCAFTFAPAAAVFTHKRIIIHNVASGAVTGVSASVQYGIDQQSIVKDNKTSLIYTVQLLQA